MALSLMIAVEVQFADQQQACKTYPKTNIKEVNVESGC
jgi:hypothetical protein